MKQDRKGNDKLLTKLEQFPSCSICMEEIVPTEEFKI